MVLQQGARYPSAHVYVVKLHRDARPALGQVFGRLEHPASGQSLVFSSVGELLDGLSRVAAEDGAAAPASRKRDD
ncbi:MAG: hypothetical protein AB7L76_23950 [Burkholderiaceae bacterium]